MNNREYRKEIALNTLEILEKGFYVNTRGENIDISELQNTAEQGTKVYSPEESDALIANMELSTPTGETEITVVHASTLDAVRNLIDEGHNDVLCLNFASAKNAGGGFLGGSQAQEESIARSTGLYNCQQLAPEYYATNRKTKSCIYTDYMIYSPAVPILKNEDGELLDKPVVCGIITAPAVNTGVVKRHEPKRMDEVEGVMKRRIKKVLAIALENNYKTLVLGAWGCGVFQNKPEDISAYFQEIIEQDFTDQFTKIVFAVYARNDRFIKPFQERFQ